MLEVTGSTRRSYRVPGERPAAYAFYSDLPRIIPYMPHIYLTAVDAAAPDQFRVEYRTVELGTYHVRIVCDLQVLPDPEQKILRIVPAVQTAFPQVVAQVGMTSAVARGLFEIESRFYAEADGRTRVDYALVLASRLPKPGGLRFVPGRVMETIVEHVAKGRLEEIVDHFIKASLQAFAAWSPERPHG